MILNLAERSLTDELTLKTGTGMWGSHEFGAVRKGQLAAVLRLQEGDKGPTQVLPLQWALFTRGRRAAPCYSRGVSAALPVARQRSLCPDKQMIV